MKASGSIEVERIGKTFAGLAAVKDVSFAIPAGQICGYLGPNGAGKSTTLKMLAGLLAPDTGSVRIAGHDLATQPLQAKRQLGFLPDGGALFPLLSAREHLALVAELYELRPAPRAGPG